MRMTDTRANMRSAQMYQRRREAGVCVRCGKKTVGGTTLCARHRAARNQYQLARYHAEKKMTKKKAPPASGRRRKLPKGPTK